MQSETHGSRRETVGTVQPLHQRHHEPVVVARIDWRITKARCSCGTELELGLDSGSPKEQAEKLVAAFRRHKKERGGGRKMPVSSARPAKTE